MTKLYGHSLTDVKLILIESLVVNVVYYYYGLFSILTFLVNTVDLIYDITSAFGLAY